MLNAAHIISLQAHNLLDLINEQICKFQNALSKNLLQLTTFLC
jgi:hypothetical protein